MTRLYPDFCGHFIFNRFNVVL